MYHAPVPFDADQQELDTADAAPEPVGYETGSERLREAHLQNGQIEARALFAPYFAITGVGAAFVTAWAMFGSVPLEMIVGWAASVSFLNWVVYRRALQAAATGSRSERRLSSPSSGRRSRPMPSPPSRRTCRSSSPERWRRW